MTAKNYSCPKCRKEGEMSLSKRMCVVLASFYLAGVVAIVVMSDPGCNVMMVLWGAPLLAAVGMIAGPGTFVAGMWGMGHGYGSAMPSGMSGFYVLLAYACYIALFVGACSKHKEIRVLCLVVEAVCAFIAAKGVAYCI